MTESGLINLLDAHLLRFVIFCGISVAVAIFAGAQAKAGRYFLMMTLAWVVVNLTVALWLNRHIHQSFPGDWYTHLLHVRHMMWINLFLDVCYALVALLFWIKGKGRFQQVYRAFAVAIWLQAVAMLLLDGYLLLKLY